MNYAYGATTNSVIGSLLPKNFWTNVLLYGILCIVISLLLFLLIREMVLWYWRINERTEALKDIAISLKNISIAMQKIEKRGRDDEDDLIGITKIDIKKENEKTA